MAGKTKKGEDKARTPTLRQKLKDDGVLQGKSVRQAALDAGYAPSTANSNVYKEQEKARTQERIRERIREANLNPQEIIGTLVSHMRGDLADILPEHKILKAAKDAGVSHLIKEIEVTEHLLPCLDGEEPIKEVKTKIKIHDSQSAAKHLTTVFGLEKAKETHPADVERQDKREEVRKYLFEQGILQSDATH